MFGYFVNEAKKTHKSLVGGQHFDSGESRGHEISVASAETPFPLTSTGVNTIPTSRGREVLQRGNAVLVLSNGACLDGTPRVGQNLKGL